MEVQAREADGAPASPPAPKASRNWSTIPTWGRCIRLRFSCNSELDLISSSGRATAGVPPGALEDLAAGSAALAAGAALEVGLFDSFAPVSPAFSVVAADGLAGSAFLSDASLVFFDFSIIA